MHIIIWFISYYINVVTWSVFFFACSVWLRCGMQRKMWILHIDNGKHTCYSFLFLCRSFVPVYRKIFCPFHRDFLPLNFWNQFPLFFCFFPNAHHTQRENREKIFVVAYFHGIFGVNSTCVLNFVWKKHQKGNFNAIEHFKSTQFYLFHLTLHNTHSWKLEKKNSSPEN